MLRCMRMVELGQMDPKLFQRAERTKKIFSITAGAHATAERVPIRFMSSINITNDGRYILVGTYKGQAYVYDTFDPSKEMRKTVKVLKEGGSFHSAVVTKVQWCPTGMEMHCTSSLDGNVAIWDTEHCATPVVHYGKKRTREKMEYVSHHINAFEPTTLAVGTKANGFDIVDLRMDCSALSISDAYPPCKHTSFSLPPHTFEVRWSSTSSNLLAGGSAFGHLAEWDIRSPRQPVMAYVSYETTTDRTIAHLSAVDCIRYACKHIYSLDNHGCLKKWDTLSGKLEGSLLCAPGLVDAATFAFDITEETDTTTGFIPGNRKVEIVNLDEMEVLRYVNPGVISISAVVYDCNNSTCYVTGNQLGIIACPHAYNESKRQNEIKETVLIQFDDLC